MKNMIIRNCALFTDCISEINNTQIDNAKEFDIVMPIYILLIEYSDNYLKTTQSLSQYYKDEPYLNANSNIVGFPVNNNGRALFEFKTKVAGRIGNDGIKDVKIMLPLKYLSSF